MDASIWDLLSSLQKSIRRGEEWNALLTAYALDAEYDVSCSKSRAGSMWSVLRRICCEDCNSPDAMYETERCWRFWTKQMESFGRNHHEPWRLYTTECVMQLCKIPKSRRVDHAIIALSPRRIAAIVDELRTAKNFRLPAYASDGIHTTNGNRLTQIGFILREDLALSPRADGEVDPYLQKILDAVAKAC
ncbi:MAG: hypothetical protein ABSE19_09225 [Candidatus Acidiferrum sp.]